MRETVLEAGELLGDGTLDALAEMDARGLGELFQRLERVRRRVEAVVALVIGEVDGRGAYRADGHATATAWCRALGRWSDVECRDRVRTGRLLRHSEAFRAAVVVGEVGVAQSHELARAHANPRCGSELVDVAELLVRHARSLSFDEFRRVVRRWESLADLDGAHTAAQEAHEDRRADVVEIGDEMHIVARGGLTQGAEIKEVFERFCDAEFSADWDATVARYGDDACYALMPRSDAQRRFDAIHRVFERAATASPDIVGSEPLLNIVADAATIEQLLNPTGQLTPPVDPRQRRCETATGIPIPPDDIVALLLWGQVRRVLVESAGVVVDMGRRRRLFTGNARQAVMLQATRCVAAGCHTPIRRCHADHLLEWGRHGATDGINGAPLCGRHNRLKNTGYRVHRDPRGYWHTYRPDGTEIR